MRYVVLAGLICVFTAIGCSRGNATCHGDEAGSSVVRNLNAYLDLAIDVAEGLGGSRKAIGLLAQYRGRAQDLLKDMSIYWDDVLDDSDSETLRLAFVMYGLLERDGIVFIHEDSDFPENIPINLIPKTERYGYRWQPKEYDVGKPVEFTLIGPSGGAIGKVTVGQGGGLVKADAGRVFEAMRALIEDSELGVYNLPIISDQHYSVILPKHIYDKVARRYGQRWNTIFSMSEDWNGIDPKIPAK